MAVAMYRQTIPTCLEDVFNEYRQRSNVVQVAMRQQHMLDPCLLVDGAIKAERAGIDGDDVVDQNRGAKLVLIPAALGHRRWNQLDFHRVLSVAGTTVQ